MKPKNKKLPGKSFAALFAEATQRDAYWVADAIYTFTEELHQLAEAKGLSRAELARRLDVSPAYITKVFRGNVNFTIETMVRLARAVGAEVQIHLRPGHDSPQTAAAGSDLVPAAGNTAALRTAEKSKP